MITYVVVLITQMLNIELRSSKLSIKNDAQKQMVESGFGRRFYDLNNFQVGIFFNSLNSLST